MKKKMESELYIDEKGNGGGGGGRDGGKQMKRENIKW